MLPHRALSMQQLTGCVYVASATTFCPKGWLVCRNGTAISGGGGVLEGFYKTFLRERGWMSAG